MADPTTELNIPVTDIATLPEVDATTLDSEIITEVALQYGAQNGVFNASAIDSELVASCYSVFEAFVIIEIVMTTIELLISSMAAIKMPRWRRNYRNQMLMQLSFARFIKRIVFLLKFLEEYKKIPYSVYFNTTLKSTEIYIDFVIVILVFFFIKHMYDSLIIVLVKISQNRLHKVLICAWLLPIPVSLIWTAVLACKLMDQWLVYLLICSIFRWPLMLLGTSVYITIVYRVMSDKIRQFARSLTVVTFLMCLFTNVYLLSRDIIELWCIESFITKIVSYSSGIFMNFLILIFYAILIIPDLKHKSQSANWFPDHSVY